MERGKREAAEKIRPVETKSLFALFLLRSYFSDLN